MNNELYHLHGFKYIKKIPVGSGFRYFYSQSEIDAYFKKGKKEVLRASKKTTTKASINIRRKNKGKAFISKKLTSRKNSFKEKVQKRIEKGKNFLDKYFNKPKDQKEIEKRKKLKKEDPYEKFKYIKKISINGKMRYFYSKDELDAYNRRSEYAKSDPPFMKQLKRSTDPYTKYEDALLVNPNFDSHDGNNNYEYNCMECSIIYELRRRGYDVESNGMSGYVDKNKGLSVIKDLYNSYKYNTNLRFTYFEKPRVQDIPFTKNDTDTAKAIYKEIDKNPPGSRGEISVKWKTGSAHSMVWEKDSKGKITIIDTQVSGAGSYNTVDITELGKRIDNKASLMRLGGLAHNTVTRTDNLKLRKGVTEICQNSTTKRSDITHVNEGTANGYYYRPLTDKEKVTKYPVLLEEENRNGKN